MTHPDRTARLVLDVLSRDGESEPLNGFSPETSLSRVLAIARQKRKLELPAPCLAVIRDGNPAGGRLVRHSRTVAENKLGSGDVLEVYRCASLAECYLTCPEQLCADAMAAGLPNDGTIPDGLTPEERAGRIWETLESLDLLPGMIIVAGLRWPAEPDIRRFVDLLRGLIDLPKVEVCFRFELRDVSLLLGSAAFAPASDMPELLAAAFSTWDEIHQLLRDIEVPASDWPAAKLWEDVLVHMDPADLEPVYPYQYSSLLLELKKPPIKKLNDQAIHSTGCFRWLVSHYPDRPTRAPILSMVEFPLSKMPPEGESSNAAWLHILREIDNGASPGGFEPLIAAAAIDRSRDERKRPAETFYGRHVDLDMEKTLQQHLDPITRQFTQETVIADVLNKIKLDWEVSFPPAAELWTGIWNAAALEVRSRLSARLSQEA